MSKENEEIFNPRGKRLAYSRFFTGGMHKDDSEELKDFKRNCAEKGVHMSYDGRKKCCGWSILLKRNNKIEGTLTPIATACKSDVDAFVDELLDEFLENIEVECKKSGIIKELDAFRKTTINKTVSGVTKRLQVIAMNRQ